MFFYAKLLWKYIVYLGDVFIAGVVAGSHYTHSGGGSNYLCLPRNPEWGKTTAGFQSGESLYGAEYELYPANDPFPKVVHRQTRNKSFNTRLATFQKAYFKFVDKYV